MTARQAHTVGWIMIAAVTVLAFVMDHFRMLTSHFNWFMAILLFVATVLVGAIGYLGRVARNREPVGTERSSTMD